MTVRENAREEILVRLLAAGLLGYLGFQQLLGGYPFHTPSWRGFAFLGAAGYCLYMTWVFWPRKAKRVVEAALERYQELRRLDPKVAEPAVEELFVNLEKQLQEETTRLRNAVTTDLKAAKQLREKLRTQLTQSTAAVREYKKHFGGDPGLPRMLEALEKRDAATRLELTDLETRIGLLSNKVVK